MQGGGVLRPATLSRAHRILRRLPLLRVASAVAGCAPRLSALMAVLVVVEGLLTGAGIVIAGHLVGAVPAAIGADASSPQARRLVFWVVAFGGVTIAQGLQVYVHASIGAPASRAFVQWVRGRIMSASLAPAGIAHLEDSSFSDKALLAQGTQYATPELVVQSVASVATQYVYALVPTLILAAYRWWAPLVLLLGLVAVRRWMHVEVEAAFRWLEGGAEAMRRSRFYRDLALAPATAKELRVFGLAGWVLGRVWDSWRASIEPVWRERRAHRGQMVAASIAVGAAYLVVFADLARGGVARTMTLTAVVIAAQAAVGMFPLATLVSNDAYYFVRVWARTLDHLDALPAVSASARITGPRTEVAAMPSRDIRFDDVSFTYPGQARPVFSGLSLTLPAGRSAGIVGVNGAGKTTLVKLLARLYDPDSGAVRVDSVDLREIDPSAWRSRVSVIFQDFVRYELSARDNVALGRHADAGALDEAARLAGADTVVAGLASGWDTVLSRAYRGGTDLSGGQWQRIALTRAVLAARDGGVLVLDEPTANLDVRAEAELFDRFLEVTSGTTAVLISHRFSSLRHADRIFVLDSGALVEEGTHDELMDLDGGQYRRMFGLQAERFDVR